MASARAPNLFGPSLGDLSTKTKVRVLAALWLFQVVNYLDRVAISFAGPSIMKSLSLAPQQFGIVLGSFSIGYFLAQIPGGLLADRWGAKALLVIAPVFWALFTGITGLVAGLVGFVVVRACFGLAEGMSNAACYKVIGDNFTSRERAGAAAIWVTAFAIAPAFTGPLVGQLLTALRWQEVFMLLAIPGLMVALVNYFAIPAHPAQPVRPDAGQARAAGGPKALFGSMLRDPALWVISLAYFCFNIAYWGYLGWMPSYLASAHHINVKAIGMLGGIPYLFAILGLLLSGWLGSTILYRFRPHLLAASYLLAALSLYLAYTAGSLTSSLVGLSAAAFFLYGGLSPFGAILLDLAPAEGRAAYSAFSSTLGQVGAAGAPIVIGFLVSASGTFAGGFAFMAGALCLAAVCMIAMIAFLPARTTPLAEDDRLAGQARPA